MLRPWRDEDVHEYGRLLRDDDVMRYLGSGWRYRLKRAAGAAIATVSDVEARRAVRTLRTHWARLGFGEWAVEEKETGRFVGQIGLHEHPDWRADQANVEVGWLLLPDAWGKGYATEGARASLAYGFGEAGLDRVISIALVANLRSVAVMERIGLAYVGRTRWHRSDVCWYAVDRADWSEAR